MFRKKNKIEPIIEEEIVVATSKDVEIDDKKVEIEEVEVIQEINIVDEEITIDYSNGNEYVQGDFTFYNNDPASECMVEEDEQSKDAEIVKKDKEELNKYFEKSKKDNSKIKEKTKKEKKTTKKKKDNETEFSNTMSKKAYVFRNKKYTKVEDFITYLNGHYLEIDKISQEVLDDEVFYGWLSRKSGVFDDSIKQFKEIKDKIEKK